MAGDSVGGQHHGPFTVFPWATVFRVFTGLANKKGEKEVWRVQDPRGLLGVQRRNG